MRTQKLPIDRCFGRKVPEVIHFLLDVGGNSQLTQGFRVCEIWDIISSAHQVEASLDRCMRNCRHRAHSEDAGYAGDARFESGRGTVHQEGFPQLTCIHTSRGTWLSSPDTSRSSHLQQKSRSNRIGTELDHSILREGIRKANTIS